METPQEGRCRSIRVEPPENRLSPQSRPRRVKAMAHRASEAHVHRDAEAAMTDRAQSLFQEHDTAARQAGSPMDKEAEFRRCCPLPRRLRGLLRVLASPRLYNEATQ